MPAVLSLVARFAGLALWSRVCIVAAEPGAYERISSRVSSLAARLSEMELASAHALDKFKSQLEQEVSDAKKKNTEIERRNAAMAKENAALANSNKELRLKAEGMRRDVKQWETDFSDVHANFSTSLEFTSKTMQVLSEGQASNELRVLDDLLRQESRAQAQQSRQGRFDAIHKSTAANKQATRNTAAFLQVPDLASKPHAYLQALDGDLTDVKAKFEQDKDSLRQKYAGLLEQERAREQTLVREQQELAKQHDELSQLQARLRAAVAFLEGSLNALEGKARSLRMFASRIGIRPLPYSHTRLAVTDAAAEDAPRGVAAGLDRKADLVAAEEGAMIMMATDAGPAASRPGLMLRQRAS